MINMLDVKNERVVLYYVSIRGSFFFIFPEIVYFIVVFVRSGPNVLGLNRDVRCNSMYTHTHNISTKETLKSVFFY